MNEQELLIEQLTTKNKKLLSICNKQTNELKNPTQISKNGKREKTS